MFPSLPLWYILGPLWSQIEQLVTVNNPVGKRAEWSNAYCPLLLLKCLLLKQ